MANGIYDLISRGIQNAKNSVTANNLNNFAGNMVPGLGQHINDLENIKNTTRGAEYFRESTNNMIQNLSDAYGRAPVVGGINQALIETMPKKIWKHLYLIDLLAQHNLSLIEFNLEIFHWVLIM